MPAGRQEGGCAGPRVRSDPGVSQGLAFLFALLFSHPSPALLLFLKYLRSACLRCQSLSREAPQVTGLIGTGFEAGYRFLRVSWEMLGFCGKGR